MWQDRPLVQAMKNAMNPGGDYGKKELSPALQNRCTEIWVRPTNDLNELRTIGLQRTSEPGQSYVVDSMVNFWQWFNQLQIARTLTIRDLLSWLAFIDATEGNLPPEDALLHGAFLVLLDGISLGSSNKDQKLSIPPMVGTVWDACSALKKTPSTNITAIGRAITQVAVSMKDVLREMKELKPASAKPNDEDSEEASVKDDSGPHDSDDSCGGDLGNDFSPEEMKIAQLAIGVVSETLVVIKEIICFITSLNKQENPNNGNDFVNPLERFLKLCQESGLQVDKLGACLYPPRVFCYEDGRGKNIQHY